MRFTTKLTTLFTVIGLFVGVVLSYFVYTSNIKILEKEITDRLEDQAFHTIDKIDRMLFERYEDIRVLANDPLISSRSSTSKQIAERLTKYQSEHKIYTSISFFDLI